MEDERWTEMSEGMEWVDCSRRGGWVGSEWVGEERLLWRRGGVKIKSPYRLHVIDCPAF